MSTPNGEAAATRAVFIDSNVPDLQDLLAGLAPGEAAFVLDPGSDGIEQIADLLAANKLTGLASISIVGHGSSGAIDLGSTVLDDGDLSSHATALAQIGAALAERRRPAAIRLRRGERRGRPAVHRRPVAIRRRRHGRGGDAPRRQRRRGRRAGPSTPRPGQPAPRWARRLPTPR